MYLESVFSAAQQSARALAEQLEQVVAYKKRRSDGEHAHTEKYRINMLIARYLSICKRTRSTNFIFFTEQGSQHETREHNLVRHMLVLFLRQQAHPGGPVETENQDRALAECADAHEHEGLSVGPQCADCVVEIREKAGQHETRRIQVLLPRHGHVQSAQRKYGAAQSRAAHVTGRGCHLKREKWNKVRCLEVSNRK